MNIDEILSVLSEYKIGIDNLPISTIGLRKALKITKSNWTEEEIDTLLKFKGIIDLSYFVYLNYHSHLINLCKCYVQLTN